MARIKTRTRADGTVSYQVHWVLGGGASGPGRPEAYETFNTRERAAAFKLDVEEAGNQWPIGWVKGAGYRAPRTPKVQPSFGDVAADFFEFQDRRLLRGRLEARTVDGYRGIYRNHLSSRFDFIPFVDVSHDDIEDWVDSKIEAGFAPKGVRNQHGVLSSIIKHGQHRMRLRQDNPCEITELPRDNRWAKRQVRFLLHEEWATLRGCLNPDVWLLVDTLLATGMRWGEATAVQAGDVHFAEDGTAQIHVQRAWKRRMANEKLPPNTAMFETSHTKLGLPKSKRTRWVMVQGELATRLYSHVGGMNTERFLFMTPGVSTKGTGPVPWRHELFAKSRWRPAVARAALLGMQRHATPHMLRHTAVVWSLADGVPIEVISEMLGHASIQVTQDVYGGLLDVKDPRMAQAMAKALLDVTGRRALSVVS